MGKEDFKYLAISGLICLFLIGAVFAIQHQAGIYTSQGSAWKRDEGTTYNYTIIINATGVNITRVNITLPSGFTFTTNSNGTNVSSGHGFSITSRFLTWNNTGSGSLFNGTAPSNESVKFWFNATATSPGNYNFTIHTYNDSGQISASTNISVHINDTTAPNVTISFPVNATNYSRSNIVFNLTVADNNMTNTCVFKLNNSAANLTLSNTSATDYNYTNTSIADGRYLAQFWCNDSDNKVNNTYWTIKRKFIIDNTAPTITHSCTPTSVIDGDVITCTCSISDAVTGLANSSYTANPTTNIIGTFTTTCTGTDYIGNKATDSLTYTVSGSGGGGGGGGGGSSFYTRTVVQDDREFSDIGEIEKSMSEKSRLKIMISDEKHYVGVIAVTTTSATINVSSIPQQITLSIGEEEDFDVTEDGYYDLRVKLNSITENKADLSVKSIENLKIAVPEVCEPNWGCTEWSKCADETRTRTCTDSNNCGTDEGKSAESEACEMSATKTWLWIVIGIVVVLIVVGVGYGVKKRKK